MSADNGPMRFPRLEQTFVEKLRRAARLEAFISRRMSESPGRLGEDPGEDGIRGVQLPPSRRRPRGALQDNLRDQAGEVHGRWVRLPGLRSEPELPRGGRLTSHGWRAGYPRPGPMARLSMAEWPLGSFYDPSMFWEGVGPIWLVHGGVTFGVAGAGLASSSFVRRRSEAGEGSAREGGAPPRWAGEPGSLRKAS